MRNNTLLCCCFWRALDHGAATAAWPAGTNQRYVSGMQDLYYAAGLLDLGPCVRTRGFFSKGDPRRHLAFLHKTESRRDPKVLYMGHKRVSLNVILCTRGKLRWCEQRKRVKHAARAPRRAAPRPSAASEATTQREQKTWSKLYNGGSDRPPRATCHSRGGISRSHTQQHGIIGRQNCGSRVSSLLLAAAGRRRRRDCSGFWCRRCAALLRRRRRRRRPCRRRRRCCCWSCCRRGRCRCRCRRSSTAAATAACHRGGC